MYLYFSICLSFSVYFFRCVRVSASFPLSLYFPKHIFISLRIYFYLSFSFYLLLYYYIYPSLFLSLSLSVVLFLCLCLSLTHSFSLQFSLNWIQNRIQLNPIRKCFYLQSSWIHSLMPNLNCWTKQKKWPSVNKSDLKTVDWDVDLAKLNLRSSHATRDSHYTISFGPQKNQMYDTFIYICICIYYLYMYMVW